MQAVARDAPRGLPSASGMTDAGRGAPAVFLLRKGNFGQPGEDVEPGFPSVFSASSALDCPGPRAAAPALGLADWLAGPTTR